MTPPAHGVAPGRTAAPTPADVRRRAHARLAERTDLARARHKPLSLLRADARRTLEQFLDHEAPQLTKAERDHLADDVVAATPGVSALEELFRDDAITEIMVLGPEAVLARKAAGGWLPTSNRFRDHGQFREVLTRFAEVGEPQSDTHLSGGVDVRLANGFRVLAVVPPVVLEVFPQVLLVRGTPTAAPAGGSGAVTPIPRELPRPAGSGAVSFALPPAPPSASSSGRVTPPTPDASSISGRMPAAAPPDASTSGRMPQPHVVDPFTRVRQRVTERIVMTFAGAGMYDLNLIPPRELQRIIIAAVHDICTHEKLPFSEAEQDRLSLEILSGMNR